MAYILNDLSAASLTNAIEANLIAHFSMFGKWSKCELHDDPEMLWTLTGVPHFIFNNVFRANLPPDRVDALIEAAQARGRKRGVPLLWWTGPNNQPSNIAERLTQHGFQGEASRGMAADLQSLPDDLSITDGLVIQPVTDKAALESTCQLWCVNFEMPEFVGEAFVQLMSAIGLDAAGRYRHYLGTLDGTPVATASLFLEAGVAGLYSVSTVPEARNKGIGAALSHRALKEAREAGYRVSTLVSSELGFNTYRKLGFEEYCKIGQYVWESLTKSD